jgi:hypothetical protein
MCQPHVALLSLQSENVLFVQSRNDRFLETAWEQDACLEKGMNGYPMAAVERMMNIQEVILRAMAKKITWWQAAEIIGITDRQMRRWNYRYKW